MEVVAGQVDGVHFGVRHLYRGRIGVLVELATNLQAGLRRRCCDQLDDDFMADERGGTGTGGTGSLALDGNGFTSLPFVPTTSASITLTTAHANDVINLDIVQNGT